MAILHTVNPELPWPKLLEDGVVSDQFEAGSISRQLTLVEDNGEPALKLLVDSASKYGSSTWLRALGRITAPGSEELHEGRTVAFAKRFRFPADLVVDSPFVIDELHGPGGVVAPFRVIVKPDKRLYVAYSSGVLRGTNASHWTPDIDAGPITMGDEHVLAVELRLSTGPAGGARVLLDGAVRHERDWPTVQEDESGDYLFPYLLTGLYDQTAETPTVCFLYRYVLADTLAEALAAVVPGPPPVEVDPLEELRARIDLLERREAALAEAAKSTHDQAFGNFKTFATKVAGSRPKE